MNKLTEWQAMRQGKRAAEGPARATADPGPRGSPGSEDGTGGADPGPRGSPGSEDGTGGVPGLGRESTPRGLRNQLARK